VVFLLCGKLCEIGGVWGLGGSARLFTGELSMEPPPKTFPLPIPVPKVPRDGGCWSGAKQDGKPLVFCGEGGFGGCHFPPLPASLSSAPSLGPASDPEHLWLQDKLPNANKTPHSGSIRANFEVFQDGEKNSALCLHVCSQRRQRKGQLSWWGRLKRPPFAVR